MANPPPIEETPSHVVGRRLPPHNLEAERSVLGSILIREHMPDDMEPLEVDDFFLPAHREIFDAMVFLEKDGSPIDVVTLAYELRKRDMVRRLDGGETYLLTMANAVPTAENAGYYSRIVKRAAILRRLVATCAEIQARAYGDFGDFDEFIAEARAQLSRIDASVGDEPIRLGDDIDNVLKVVEEKATNPEKHFVRSGLRAFDTRFGGLARERLYVVASNPGGGKSSWGLDVAIRSAQHQQIPNLIFSLEMPRQEMIERSLGATSGIETRRIHRGALEFADWKTLHKASKILDPLPLWIYDRPIGIDRICAIARRWATKFPGKLLLVTIDYLQIIRRAIARGRNEADVIGDITRETKLLAKDIKSPVVLISQLNRENKKEKTGSGKSRKPRPEDLKGSGSIEADADVIIFTWPDQDATPGELRIGAELLIGKNRGGPTGSIACTYDKAIMSFQDVETMDDAPTDAERRFADP